MAQAKESSIEIYLRMRPMEGRPAKYEVEQEEGRIQWTMPRNFASGVPNHQRERYDFSFNGILDVDTKQDAVFATVAQKVVLGALEGYNGTIFAYGQTGSGKTYTITGGAERYVDRGIIPRAISFIYSELSKKTEYTYTLYFSYLEIYNETGYDLLHPEHQTKCLEDLPKVVLLEDDENCFHLRNLSAHLATNEEEALNLLFLGDTNRMISATPLNMASSRSHCIFTANIEARKAGEEIVRRSKLHLVDLAGSERVSKSGVDGQILKEAKYINLSLHFLEQVIVALQERSQGKSRQHIPYRNSMMTSVLRDSLGGNCQTVMIATVSIAQEQLEETISTCRFAQRVALVSNQVMVNEEIDPSLVIKRLKQQIKDLKVEIQLLRGEGEERGPLVESEISTLQKQVINFVNDTSTEATLNVGASMLFIRAVFNIFKEMINKPEGAAAKCYDPQSQSHSYDSSGIPNNALAVHEMVQNLQRQLQQRENEINILVSFIRKRDLKVTSIQASEDQSISTKEVTFLKFSPRSANSDFQEKENEKLLQQVTPDKMTTLAGGNRIKDGTILSDRKQAFDLFQRNYPKMDVIDENKRILKNKYSEAKSLGDQVNKARERINDLKHQIERHRVDRAIQGMVNGTNLTTMPDVEEKQMIELIDKEKSIYREGFSKLRDLKKEIEHLNLLLQQSQTKLKADFEQWLIVMSREQFSSSYLASEVAPNDIASLGAMDPSMGYVAQNPISGIQEFEKENHVSETKKLKQTQFIDLLSTNSLSNERLPLKLKEERSAENVQRTARHKLFNLESGDVNNSKQSDQSSTRPQSGNSSTKSMLEDIPLTGNSEVDANVLAFYQAHSNVMKLKSLQHPS